MFNFLKWIYSMIRLYSYLYERKTFASARHLDPIINEKDSIVVVLLNMAVQPYSFEPTQAVHVKDSCLLDDRDVEEHKIPPPANRLRNALWFSCVQCIPQANRAQVCVLPGVDGCSAYIITRISQVDLYCGSPRICHSMLKPASALHRFSWEGGNERMLPLANR